MLWKRQSTKIFHFWVLCGFSTFSAIGFYGSEKINDLYKITVESGFDERTSIVIVIYIRQTISPMRIMLWLNKRDKNLNDNLESYYFVVYSQSWEMHF